LTGVAVKVTEPPWQKGFEDATMEILTGWFGTTIMVIALEVAGLFEMHVAIEEVRTQVTISPLIGV
jgi:hypothetical protein